MKMKMFAIDIEGNVVDLVFRDEDEIDGVFSSILKNRRLTGKVVDNSGKTVIVDASYGYSNKKSDFSGIKK